jgi:histidine ammonia-lyase
MSLEAFRANLGPLEDRTLAIKRLPGQMAAGQDLRQRLSGSLLLQKGQARRLQDPLSIRNVAQIHGTLSAALSTAIQVTEIEMNGISDNPVAFLETQEIISCGAFFTSELTNAIEGLNRAFVHLTVAQLARISKLLNPVFSDLPAFLAGPHGGSNGFAPLMKPAEALVSELLHAAQPVPIWPSINANGVEDCIAGSPTAVRALTTITDCARRLTAIELIVACQAVDARETVNMLGPFLADIHVQIRGQCAVLEQDRPFARDVENIARTIASRELVTPKQV